MTLPGQARARWRATRFAFGLAAWAVATCALAASTPSAWIFDGRPSFPGLRMIKLTPGPTGAVSGVMTTDWYGPMAMQDLSVDDGRLDFYVSNGNPKLGREHWTGRISGAGLSVDGRIWSTTVQAQGRPATVAEVRANSFPVAAPLPFRALGPEGQAPTPPMGWSSWNAFADHVDQAQIEGIADALVASGLRDAGYIYVNIDDGWQGERGIDGEIHPNARFPDMKALGAYLHARGLKLGLYSSPGPKTCAGYTGSYGHVAQDARTYARWGVDFLKYDLCSGEAFYRTKPEIEAAYDEMGVALRATGRPIVYSLCEYGRDDVGKWGRAVGGHLWRTSGDIIDTYAGMAANGFDHGGDPGDAGPGGWNDPDMLEIGNGGMTTEEYRTHLSLWSMSAAPLILGDDVRRLSSATRALLADREVVAVDQDPLGVAGRRVWQDGVLEVWRKPLKDGSAAVALFNRGETPFRIPMTSEAVGFARLSRMRNLWTAADVDLDLKAFDTPAHGVVLLRVWPASTAGKTGIQRATSTALQPRRQLIRAAQRLQYGNHRTRSERSVRNSRWRVSVNLSSTA